MCNYDATFMSAPSPLPPSLASLSPLSNSICVFIELHVETIEKLS